MLDAVQNMSIEMRTESDITTIRTRGTKTRKRTMIEAARSTQSSLPWASQPDDGSAALLYMCYQSGFSNLRALGARLCCFVFSCD